LSFSKKGHTATNHRGLAESNRKRVLASGPCQCFMIYSHRLWGGLHLFFDLANVILYDLSDEYHY